MLRWLNFVEQPSKLSKTGYINSARNIIVGIILHSLCFSLTSATLLLFLSMMATGQNNSESSAPQTSQTLSSSFSLLPTPTVCVKKSDNVYTNCAMLTQLDTSTADLNTWSYELVGDGDLTDADIGGTRLILLDPVTHLIVYDSEDKRTGTPSSWHEPTNYPTSTDKTGTIETK